MTYPENTASQHVLEKRVFVHIGFKEYYGVALRLYELLKDAWRP